MKFLLLAILSLLFIYFIVDMIDISIKEEK